MLLPLAFAAALALAADARAEQVVERDDDGNVVRKYVVDEDGLPHGAYHVFFPGGKRVRSRTQYRNGLRHGEHVENHPTGKLFVKARYENGRLHGPRVELDPLGHETRRETFDTGLRVGEVVILDKGEVVERQTWDRGDIVTIDGRPVHPRSKDDIRLEIEQTFEVRDPLEKAPDDPKAKERGRALRRLMAYRAVVGVPWRDMALDADMNRFADKGSLLCERIGRLDHTPDNPGMPEDEYKAGYRGTSHSNLFTSSRGKVMVNSVRGYMDDSDASNIARVGHRRWCINPRMLKTGFGDQGAYSAMWSMDASRPKKECESFETVSYPPDGFLPTEYFQAHYAWSVSFYSRKWNETKRSAIEITVQPMSEDWRPQGDPLPLEHVTVADGGMGDRFCLIFRPKGIAVESGNRFRVLVKGLTYGGEPHVHRMHVEFFEL